MAFAFGLATASVSAAPAAKETVLEDSISRTVFNTVYREGPQRFIASLHVKPHVVGTRFVGYTLVGFEPTSPMKGGQYIQVGDTVMSVNGYSLEKPDQFMKAWQRLRTAKTLEVRVRRGEKTFTVRWHISA